MARPTVRLNDVTLPPQMIAAEAQHHPARTPAAAFESAARALIIRTLLLEEAARLGLTATPLLVADGKRELADEAQIRLLLETCIPVPQVEDSECLAYYQQSGERFQSPELVEVSHILFAADPRNNEAMAEAKAAAREALAMLADQPGLFDTLARERSGCASKSNGGRLGQLSPDEVVPEFKAALATLSAGEIKPELIKTRFGFHIVRLDARLLGRALPFSYVRDSIGAYLGERAWRRDAAAFIGRLAGAAKIEGVTMDTGTGGGA
jgi:peptidyl-prolyl cis-trans isomerase C